jgi:hypothetical protein
MNLNSSQIATIARQVQRQFPEMRNALPLVQNQAGAKTLGAATDRFVLTFRGRGAGPGGQSIQRIVRVVADARGKVLKISTSR